MDIVGEVACLTLVGVKVNTVKTAVDVFRVKNSDVYYVLENLSIS